MTKNLKRPQRLEIARGWVEQFAGKRIIHAYRKKFDISSDYAIEELQMLGITLKTDEKKAAKHGEKARARKRKAKKKARAEQREKALGGVSTKRSDIDQDDTYAFIAGYTDWGFPYGLTWGEMEQMSNDASLFNTIPPENRVSELDYIDPRVHTCVHA